MSANDLDPDDIGYYDDPLIEEHLPEPDIPDTETEDDGDIAGTVGGVLNESLNPSPIQWSQMKIGEQILLVSSEGLIKKVPQSLFEPASQGFKYLGTPYRVFPIQRSPSDHVQNVFVHDIVYRAFFGEPPTGWDVRHRTQNYSNNSIANLTIYPTLVEPNPTLL